MFEKVIVFRLFAMIHKKTKKQKKNKKSENRIPGSGFGLRAESGMTARAVTLLMLGTVKPGGR